MQGLQEEPADFKWIKTKMRVAEGGEKFPKSGKDISHFKEEKFMPAKPKTVQMRPVVSKDNTKSLILVIFDCH